jgi:hypothetical protein
MALFLLSVLSLFQWTTGSGLMSLFIGLAAMQLATLANLSLLVVNMLSLTWVAGWLFIKLKSNIVPSCIMLMASAGCLSWFVNLSFEYKERGLLYYGSGAGIWDATLGSLAAFAFPSVQTVFPYFGLAIVLTLVLVALGHLIKQGINEHLLFSYLFLGALVAVIVMHHLMGVNYPEDRVAMHFLILAPLAVVFPIERLLSNGINKKLPKVLMGASLLLLVFPLNTALSANLTHVTLWKEDACARLFYEHIKAESEKAGTMPTIAGYRLRDLPLYYYGFKNDYPVTVIQDIAYGGDEADYQYALLSEEGQWDKYEKLAYSEAANLHLLKKKTGQTRMLWIEKAIGPSQKNAEPYTVFFESDIDSMANKDLLWEIELRMPRVDEPFQAWITTDIGTPEGKSVMQETIVLDWLKPTWKQGELLKQKILMPNIPPDASHIKLFFWNIEEKPIALGEANIKLVELASD